MKLHNLAHSRTGDKGDTSNISIIAYRKEDYPLLCEQLTAARVAEFLPGCWSRARRRCDAMSCRMCRR